MVFEPELSRQSVSFGLDLPLGSKTAPLVLEVGFHKLVVSVGDAGGNEPADFATDDLIHLHVDSLLELLVAHQYLAQLASLSGHDEKTDVVGVAGCEQVVHGLVLDFMLLH